MSDLNMRLKILGNFGEILFSSGEVRLPSSYLMEWSIEAIFKLKIKSGI